MTPTIVQQNNPVLHQKALAIPIDDITKPKVKTVIANMKKVLAECDDGLALAAPQIGQALRIFIITGKLFTTKEKKRPDLVFINPSLVKTSSKTKLMEEGCLSVRWFYGKVKRAEKATVEAYNEYGQKFQLSGSNLLAQIFQHEIDHLDGILFNSKAVDLIEIKPDETSNSDKIL
jgi:peptide deformylase